MSKTTLRFVCQSCGAQQHRWHGQCSECAAWNTLVEERATPHQSAKALANIEPQLESIVQVQAFDRQRQSTNVQDLDMILGGGLVPGEIILIGGEPGVGKSTLLTQVAMAVANTEFTVLYVSGEESPHQVKLRANRLGSLHENFLLSSATTIPEVVASISAAHPHLVIIDSIQSMTSPDLESAAGSVSQVRECGATLQTIAKQSGIPILLIGHVSKDGQIAGPKVLEHLVDAVLFFEGAGHGKLRTLRATKNRFGTTDELAVFEMSESGLLPVPNPSELLLAERQTQTAGSAVFATFEGRRSMLVEVQALVTPNYTQSPRRVFSGLDPTRALLVIGVAEKRANLRIGGHDIYINIVGGFQLKDPGIDLAVFMALASSFKDAPIPEDLVCFGEIGLTGEIRSVGGAESRLKEAARMGFTRAATSRNIKLDHQVPGIKLGGLRNVGDALGLLG